ncbi:MAG: hypothetical protein ACT4NL_10395 [Pseudomarimonas sp.]
MRLAFLVLLSWLAVASTVNAAEFRVQALIDLDQDPQTGCAAGADFGGNEWRLLAHTDRERILDSRIESCRDGIWRLEHRDEQPRTLGIREGANGGDLIAWSLPLRWFSTLRQLPLHFVVERIDQPAQDQLDADGDWVTLLLGLPGDSQVIPALGPLGLSLLVSLFGLVAWRSGRGSANCAVIGATLLSAALLLALTGPSGSAHADGAARFEVSGIDARGDVLDAGADLLAAQARVVGDQLQLQVEVRNIGTDTSTEPQRVLFIGNSLTYSNDLPAMLVAVAAQAGKSLHADALTIPGASLQEHYDAGDVQIELANGDYQRVIMQQGPSSLPESQAHLREWTRVMDELIRNAGARPALYMVWPDATRFSFFDAVRRSYSNAAMEVDGMFIPAGEAWRAAWRLDPNLSLFASDDFHPSALGTYGVALSMYAALYQRSPVGLPAQLTLANGRVHRFSATDVRRLQEAAWTAHQQYWRPGS